MNTSIIKIDSSFTNETIDQTITSVLDNLPFTRDVINTITTTNFFNSTLVNSIRSPAGFLTYYHSLSESEVTGLKALFKFMNQGLHINLSFEAPGGDVQETSDIMIIPPSFDQNMIFHVGYMLDENNVSTSYIIGKIPGSRDLIKLIVSYNNKEVNCILSLEELFFEAMKEESFE